MGDSYWQQGCDDGRAGLPLDERKRHRPGYYAGWLCGGGIPIRHSPPLSVADPDAGDGMDDWEEDTDVKRCPHCDGIL